ncbi:MAG: hypothetical protein FD180_4875 [Planctomycetota bacterium]|nr:MAG: hypothetical protein FD180_4875 [Planctomycetota bacterium]
MSTKKGPAPPPAPKPRRWQRKLVLFVVLPLAGFLAFFKWVVAPLVVRQGIMVAVAARIRGRLEIRHASVGFREVELRGVTLFDATGRVAGTADAVVLRTDRFPVGFGTPGIESIRLVHPDIVMTLEPDGELDLQRVLAAPPSPQAPAVQGNPSANPAPPPPLSPLLPEKIAVENGTLRLVTPMVSPTFSGLDATLHVEPRRFTLENAAASTLGGRASLSGWLGRGPEEGWKLDVNVAEANVLDLVQGTRLEGYHLAGRLDGYLTLTRGSTGAAVGAGWLDARDGRLLDLPVILSVFNVLHANDPGESFVKTCRTDFRVLEDRIHVERWYVITDGFSLFGDGDILFDGQRLDLDFVPRLSSEPPEGYDTLADAEQPVADFIRKNALLSVEVKGTWMSPEAETTPLRVITKPLKDFFGLLRGKGSR